MAGKLFFQKWNEDQSKNWNTTVKHKVHEQSDVSTFIQNNW